MQPASYCCSTALGIAFFWKTSRTIVHQAPGRSVEIVQVGQALLDDKNLMVQLLDALAISFDHE